MKGTIHEFLALVAKRPQLAKDLVALAARHGFEFSSGELTDAELRGVVGGADTATNLDLQNKLQSQQQLLQSYSNVSKMLYDTSLGVVRKIG